VEVDPIQRFEQAVLGTIRQRGLLAPGERVVVGVSGGPDSLALIHALHALSGPLGIALHVAHLNHRLRRAAPEEARFVAETAERLGIPCTVEAVDVRAAQCQSGLSLEHAARNERYRFFLRTAKAVNASKVATAHTADDTVETVLLNLLRGAATDGLAGIPPCRALAEGVVVVRPLIDAWRAEVEAYCRAMKLHPREDTSNRSRAFLRNRVRLDILPYLTRHFGEEVKPNLRRLAELARPEVELLDHLTAEATTRSAKESEEGIAISVRALGELPLALRRRVARSALRRLAGDPTKIGYREVQRLLETLEGERADFDLPGPVHVRREGDQILLTPPGVAETAPGWEVLLPVPGEAPLPDGSAITAEVGPRPPGFAVPRVPRAREVFLDAEAVTPPLHARSRLPGDCFTPLGMTGRKSLQDLFTDAKVPVAARTRTPVVLDARGIVWVAGLALADRVKVTPETRRLLRLRWSEPLLEENGR